MKNVCGLGMFAEEAAKAGYKNSNGTVNLFLANSVVQKFGKLIPKSQLSVSDLKEIEGASKKISERLNIQKDTFVK